VSGFPLLTVLVVLMLRTSTVNLKLNMVYTLTSGSANPLVDGPFTDTFHTHNTLSISET